VLRYLVNNLLVQSHRDCKARAGGIY